MSGPDTIGKVGPDTHAAKAHAPNGGGHGGGGGHDEEEHTGAPEWLISFADNTALLMGFFVIMLALTMALKSKGGSGTSSSSGNAGADSQAAIDFAIGVREAFNNPVSINSTKPGEQAMVHRLRELYGNDAQDENVRGRREKVQSLDRGENYAVSAMVLFDAKRVTSTADSHQQIADFAEHAKGLNLVVEVRGHTSQSEVEGNPVAAMQLSYERAFQVAQELVGQGIPWNRIRLMAIGSNERDGGEMNNPDRKAQNQRVELILTSDLARD